MYVLQKNGGKGKCFTQNDMIVMLKNGSIVHLGRTQKGMHYGSDRLSISSLGVDDK